MRLLSGLLVGLVFLSCGERPMPVAPAAKAAGGGLFDLFKEGGSSIVGVDSTAAVETPSDSTAAAGADTTEHVVVDTVDTVDTVAAVGDTTETVVSLSPSDARAALARLGIDYTVSAFIDSAGAGNLEVVKLFVEAGMSVDTANADSHTALHFAAWYGRLEVVKYLLGAGADVNVESDTGVTALHEAASTGLLDVVQLLVGSGADLEVRDQWGSTALHSAATWGRLEVVEFLVGQGLAVDARDEDGGTPRDRAEDCSTNYYRSAATRAHCAAVVSYFDSL